MRKDISQGIIVAKGLLKDAEKLNSNPAMYGYENLYNTVIKLDLCVQQLLADMESK
jgi:hypothetical protein